MTIRFNGMVIRNQSLKEIEKWRFRLERTGARFGRPPHDHTIDGIKYTWDTNHEQWERVA